MKEVQKVSIEQIINEEMELEIYKGFYIPQSKKEEIVKSICQTCISSENSYYKVHRALMNKTFYLTMIDIYTNIKVENYENEVYDKIKSLQIDVSYLEDIKTFAELLKNTVEEIEEENKLERIVANTLYSLQAKIDTVLESLDKMLEKGDPNKIAKYLSKGIEKLADKMPDFNELEKQSYKETIDNIKKDLN